MTFGFPAYHEEQVELPRPVTHAWIVAACAAAGFQVPAHSEAAPTGTGRLWRTSSPTSLASWGENLTLTTLGPTTLHVRSQCAFPTQCFDWGRNAKNVRRIVDALHATAGTPTPAPAASGAGGGGVAPG